MLDVVTPRRILMLPLICTTGEIHRESEFTVWWQFAREWADQGHTCIMVIPAKAQIPQQHQHPNVHYYRSERWFPYLQERSFVDADVIQDFSPLNGQYPVDMIFTSRSGAALSLARLMEMGESLRIPVLLMESWVQNNWKSDASLDLKLRAAAYSEVPTFFPTQREYRFGMEMVRHVMSPSSLKNAQDICVERSHGVPLRRIQSLGQSTKKFPDPTLVFAARFNPNKQWAKLLKVYERIAITRPEVKVKAVKLGVSDSNPVDLSFLQKTEILDPLPRGEYEELLCQSWISASMSLDEGFSFGFAEQVATGNPVMFPARSWVASLVSLEWPFIYRDEKELIAMINWCLDNYEKARAMVKPLVDKFVEKHDISVSAAEVLARGLKEVPSSYSEFQTWDQGLARTLAKCPAKFTMMEFAKLALKEEGYHFGGGTLQFAATGNYRNLYFWLRQRANLERDLELTFTKKV